MRKTLAAMAALSIAAASHSFEKPDYLKAENIRVDTVLSEDGEMLFRYSGIPFRYYFSDSYEADIPNGVTMNRAYRIYLGGDAYTAPLVAAFGIRQTYTLHHIVRDYQGSVMMLIDSQGNVEQELSYTPWGMLRDSATHEPYGINNQPVLLTARGYCGHEHLTKFGLINMNARLYDPCSTASSARTPLWETPPAHNLSTATHIASTIP